MTLHRIAWYQASLVATIALVVFSQKLTAQQTTSTQPEVGIVENPNETFALIHARIVVEPGRELEDATLIIRDGKIEDVGVGIDIPKDARQIDFKGKTLYPGFVDAGVEIEIPPPASPSSIAHWNSEITPDRSVATELPSSAESAMTKLRKGGITTALIAPRDGIVKGKSAVYLTGGGPFADSLLRSDVALHVKLTVARGRGRESYPGSPMGAVALARQTFLDAQWYTRAWQTYKTQSGLEKPEENRALAILAAHMSDGSPVIFDALNEQYALRADSFGREFGLNVILKGSGQEYQLLDKIAKLNRTIILPVNFPKPPAVASLEQAMDVELEELTHWELAPENPARLAKAGIPFVITSSGLTDPNELLPHVRKAVARGLDRSVALASLTSQPAQLLGVADTCGTLKRGAWANIIVVQGDLFDEKGKMEEVWVRGERPAASFNPKNSIDGKWDLTITPQSTLLPSTLVMSISDSTKKISGQLQLQSAVGASETKSPSDKEEKPIEPKSEDATKASEQKDAPVKAEEAKKEDKKKEDEKGKSKLKSPKWQDITLSATFSTEPLAEGTKGTAYLSLAWIAGKEPGEDRLHGSIRWPDGTYSTVVGVPAAAQDKTKSTTEEVSDGKKADPTTGKDSDKVAKDHKENKVLSPTLYPVGTKGRNGIPEQSDWVLFKNATLWTCGPLGLLEKSDLLIHQGVIHSIGSNLTAPEGAKVVDATGLQLSPGLIDCHSHMATDSGVNESTQAVTAEVRIGDFIDAGDITIYRQLAGGLTTANVLHGSANPIGGQNQVVKLRWGATYDDLKFKEAPAGIKFALGENVKQSNWEGSPKTRYPQSRMGVEQLFRDRFLAAQRYMAAWKEWDRNPKGLPPRRDLELDALAEILRGERWIHCHSYRQDEILGLLRVLDEFKIKIGSLQHILEGYKVAEEIAKHGATASSFSDWWAYKFEVQDSIPYNGAIMHHQGIVVSFNSDDAELGRHMNHEAAKAIKYGNVEPMSALQFVTLNPAKQLRIDNYVGSLEVGKHADIAVWSGSPLSPMSRCEQTWIDGRKYFDRQQDKEDRKRDAALHAALVQKVIESGEPGAERSSLATDPSRLWPNHDEFCHHHHEDHEDEIHNSMEAHDQHHEHLDHDH